MDIQNQVWLISAIILAIAVAILCYVLYRKRGKKDQLIQGMVAICGGLMILISLFYPWITVLNAYPIEMFGFDIGEIFVSLANTQFVKVIAMFLLLFGNLTLLGGFLRLVGYELGKQLVSVASGLALFLSVVVVLALGALPTHEVTISFAISPWIYITGAILGLVSVKLEFGK